MKLTKEEFLSNLFTRREAEQYAGLTAAAMQHHLRKGNISPCKEYGKGNGKVQLFWKDDLEKIME